MALAALNHTDSWHLTWCHIIAIAFGLKSTASLNPTPRWWKTHHPGWLYWDQLEYWWCRECRELGQDWWGERTGLPESELCLFFNCTNCYYTLTKCSGDAEQVGVLVVQTFLRAAPESETETLADVNLHSFFILCKQQMNSAPAYLQQVITAQIMQ